jgi:hypothetical protein
MTITPTTPAPAEPDLRGFLLAHAGFRTEYGRLAGAARAVRDAGHAALIEDQLQMVSKHLEHHHGDEDAWMWPLLRSRRPGAVAALDALEEQHEHIDPLLHQVGDDGRALPDRAGAMDELHRLLNDHLDHEERDAVPLLRAVVLPDEFKAAADRSLAAVPKRQIPTLFGWMASCGSPEQVASVLTTFPLPVRLLFRLVWWPAYRRRFTSLYGGELRRHADR